MIIVRLMGGCGNQMFQYAFGRNLSLKYNVPLKLDLSFLKRRDMGPNFTYRDYDLDIFNIKEDFQHSGYTAVVNEPHFNYSGPLVKKIDEVYKLNKLNLLIDGYWQSPKYFSEFEQQIRSDFTFKNTITDSELLSNILSSNSVMINIRRTDYLNTNYHGVLDMTYINSGINIINQKVKNPQYFIFSDDIEWCRQNIHLDNMTIVDHSHKGDRFSNYLQLMTSCKHFIIPNSTFAWWAAWLNSSKSKVVVSPKDWFADKNTNTTDLIPSNWIRI